VIALACIDTGLPPSAFLEDPEIGEHLLDAWAEMRRSAAEQERPSVLNRLKGALGR
jgi:hypothetical protein